MSLVNDLLIEIDRNRNGATRSDAEPLAGLSPSSPQQPQKKGSLRRISTGLILVAASCFGFALARMNSDPVPVAAVSADQETLPRVSAKRPSTLTEAPTTPTQALAEATFEEYGVIAPVQDIQFERPVALRQLRVGSSDGRTRIEIETDRSTNYQILAGLGAGDFKIVLEKTALRRPLPALDLVGTGIKRIQTVHEDDGIRLQLSLDGDARVQSQRIDQSDGSLFIVDFHPATAESNAPESAEALSRNSQPTQQTAQRKASSRPKAQTEFRGGNESQDRITNKVRSQEKGAISIARSAGDEKRAVQAEVRKRADLAVENARAARQSGDLDAAKRYYEQARASAPENQAAVIEGAAVLVEQGNFSEALSLIEAARKQAPRQTSYLMAHAQILAREDLSAAIALLDAARVDLANAPGVHALTAAYLQKNGQHDAAIERYEALLRRFPNQPKSWMGLGISLEARGRTEEALDVYQIALQLGELPAPSKGWVSARVSALREEI